MAIHEMLTRRGLAKILLVCQKGRERYRQHFLYEGDLRVLCALRQGYANTEESLGNSVLLISDMSDVTGDASFPPEVKLKAALRLLFTKQPA